MKKPKSFRFEGSFEQYWATHGSVWKRFLMRMSRWGKNFDEFFDNILTVPQGTPWQIVGQVVLKLTAVAIMAAGMYIFLVLGLAM